MLILAIIAGLYVYAQVGMAIYHWRTRLNEDSDPNGFGFMACVFWPISATIWLSYKAVVGPWTYLAARQSRQAVAERERESVQDEVQKLLEDRSPRVIVRSVEQIQKNARDYLKSRS